MAFLSKEKLNIINEEAFPTAIEEITRELNACGRVGEFMGCKQIRLHYKYFLVKNCRGSIVIVHGLSEFTEKFYELTYYLMQQGYNVFVYDQRGHGNSQRMTQKRDLLHVDCFEDYVKDLDCFIDTVVTPISDVPLYLYAHSMGGGIAALYLSKHGNKIKKAVLSAPMFRPNVKNVNPTVARWGVKTAMVFVGKKRQFPLSHEFNPEAKYKPEFDDSRTRFEHYMTLRRNNENYQTTPMSFGWVCASLDLLSRVLSRRVVKRITTPILLLSGDRDRVVELEPQYKFAQKCETCCLKRFPNATHSLLTSCESLMQEILQSVLAFYES